MRTRAVFALIFLFVLAARLSHLRILWIEECYPAAGALQVLFGKVPYRDFWFDKPPLSMAPYLLWGAETGWPLRVAGALFVTLVSWKVNQLSGLVLTGILVWLRLTQGALAGCMVSGLMQPVHN